MAEAAKDSTNVGQSGIDRKEMMLESASGYVMPFMTGHDGADMVEVTLRYGEQPHPMHGGTFFHHGWDFVANHVPLYAVASGTVIGVGNDAVHGNYVVVRYGKYEVKYGHISEAYAPYGSPVVAGQQIATSGDFLHLGVTFKGVELDPQEFIMMLLNNVEQLAAMGIKRNPLMVNMGVEVKTDYDKDQDEILDMMLRYMASYMRDILAGRYVTPSRTQQSLRNVFAQSGDKGYFFEEIPDVGNPLGVGRRALPLASKVHNLLIGDFLNYMALRHDKYVSTWDESQKKNFQKRQKEME